MLNNRFIATLFKTLILPLLMLPSTVFAEYGLNLPEGVTPISRDIYGLHMKGSPAGTNLVVPPYYYKTDTLVRIGEDGGVA